MTRGEFLKKLAVLGALGLIDYRRFCFAGAKDASSRAKALYWRALEDSRIECELCPRRCLLKDKQSGFCGVRVNDNGQLYSLVYSQAAAVHIDPIEKKPLYHFLPATTAFSLATAGCNLRCKFCQNWEISQSKPDDIQPTVITPVDIVSEAKRYACRSIAYTYTEPTVFYEYMRDTALAAKAGGLKNVMHSAGFINEGPLRQLCKYLDAANIDLKAFNQGFYQDVCFGDLEKVLETLKILRNEFVHLEITNLIVTGLNDSAEEIRQMCLWIKENLGAQTPLHFSRFWPMYKLINLAPTPLKTLETAKAAAESAGLKYVYIGNVPGHKGESTFCPVCGRNLIERIGYTIKENNLAQGSCKYCNAKIPGVWA